MKQRVVVGMSGGVDSSVAALLLLEAGYDVHGVFMKNWEDRFAPGYCSVEEDLSDAQDVADTLGIVLHKVEFVAEYRQRVFEYFLAEYRRGRTPNPDILCNNEIKFKAFLDHAVRLGADGIATGHYARSTRGDDGRARLLKAKDPGKDQTYFLHGLTQRQLAPARFPLGELLKAEVRRLAEANDLVTFDKKDSTGICFIGERDFRAFLQHFIPSDPGPMVTPSGDVVGEHVGLAFYTLGQRRGLGIGGTKQSNGAPWFVIGKDRQCNTLLVAQGDHPRLYSVRTRASAAHWIGGGPPSGSFRCTAKTRYRQTDQACTVTVDGQSVVVDFDRPQRAVTPGQSVVFYDRDECLGGAVIDSTEQASTENRIEVAYACH